MNADPSIPATCSARRAWIGAAAGLLGGLAGSAALGAPLFPGCLLGAVLGLGFGLGFGARAHSPGAGLIWGLAFALLGWVVLAAAAGATRAAGMMQDARARFPELVAALICFGLPVGLALGILGSFQPGEGRYNW
jgi:hypothetical protein